jgi:hypothetical protein
MEGKVQTPLSSPHLYKERKMEGKVKAPGCGEIPRKALHQPGGAGKRELILGADEETILY